MSYIRLIIVLVLSVLWLQGYGQRSSSAEVRYTYPVVEGTAFLIRVGDDSSERERYAIFHKIPYDKTPFAGKVKQRGDAYCIVSRASGANELMEVERYLRSKFKLVEIEQMSVAAVEQIIGARLNPAKPIE